MRLLVKVIPLRARTSEPAGEPRLVCCPPDVEPDTILSFLTQQLGEVIQLAQLTHASPRGGRGQQAAAQSAQLLGVVQVQLSGR